MPNITDGVTLNVRHEANRFAPMVRVVVEDEAVRKQAAGFDGCESVFVRVRGQDGLIDHQLEWQGSYCAGGKTFDVHEAKIPFSTGPEIQVGMRTNVGTLMAAELGRDRAVQTGRTWAPSTHPKGITVQGHLEPEGHGERLSIRVAVEPARLPAAQTSGALPLGVFAKVPRGTEAGIEWTEAALAPLTHYSAGHGRTRHFEVFETELGGVDGNTVERLGIAIGVRTEDGVVWAQQPGQNHRIERR